MLFEISASIVDKNVFVNVSTFIYIKCQRVDLELIDMCIYSMYLH